LRPSTAAPISNCRAFKGVIIATSPETSSTPSPALIQLLLDALDALSGLHPGFRPAHAKGAMCSGTFTPSPEAPKLTRAPHATRPSTPVIARFSDSSGLPTVADNDPQLASPRGFAVRFYLADHVHTDIVAHSHDGFPVRTGEEFLELLRAVAALRQGQPAALGTFLAGHPRAKHFVEAPKPIPSSFARESFFAVTAFRFTNQQGQSRYGRFRIRPDAGNDHLTAANAASRPANFLFDELTQRLGRGPVKLAVSVQLAEDDDNVADATATWPDSRREVAFGTITLTARVNDADPEMRKIIFDPVPRVDGIDPSADPIIMVRSAIYLLSGRRRRAAAAR
jgi:catalase